ncbi:MAG: hypothetical protein ACI3Y5_02600 [Prevotella sp.]
MREIETEHISQTKPSGIKKQTFFEETLNSERSASDVFLLPQMSECPALPYSMAKGTMVLT